MYECMNQIIITTHHIVDSRLRFWLQSVIDDSLSALICLFRLTAWFKLFVLSKYESIIRPIKPVRPGKSTKNRWRGCDGSTWGTWEDRKHDQRSNVKFTHIIIRIMSVLILMLSLIILMSQTQYLHWTRINSYIDSQRNINCRTHKCTYICHRRPAGASRQHARPLA